jgi:alpha 1,6-mannosyltransferase
MLPDEGSAAMRLHKGRTFRRLLFILIACVLLFVLFSYEPITLPVLAFAPTSPIQTIYNRHPVYEYTSVYRVKANLTFERELEEQLLTLQRDVGEKLPKQEKDLVAKKRIWQITTPELAESWESWSAQWRDNNAGWEYTLHTSPPTDLLPLFESIPEITEAIERFTSIREDLMRYLILWYHGGFWTAIDTWDRVAMRDCNPIVQVTEGKRKMSLMIGIDNDEPFLNDNSLKQWGWTRGFGFGQAVIWAPRRFDPVLRKAIVRTISHAIVEESLPKGSWSQRQLSKLGAKADYSGELSGTGMFTDIVLEMLSDSLVDDHILRDRDGGLEKRVTWKKLSHLREVLWLETDQVKQRQEEGMSGMAILPLNVWGNGQSHSRSGPAESDDACVNHIHGWRPQKHNIFG